MEEIQNLTEEQAKLLLQYAVGNLSSVCEFYSSSLERRLLLSLLLKIKTLSKENTEK